MDNNFKATLCNIASGLKGAYRTDKTATDSTDEGMVGMMVDGCCPHVAISGIAT